MHGVFRDPKPYKWECACGDTSYPTGHETYGKAMSAFTRHVRVKHKGKAPERRTTRTA